MGFGLTIAPCAGIPLLVGGLSVRSGEQLPRPKVTGWHAPCASNPPSGVACLCARVRGPFPALGYGLACSLRDERPFPVL